MQRERPHLSGTGHGQPVQLEAVRPIAVGCLRLQVLGQVDDRDRRKRALSTPSTGRTNRGRKAKKEMVIMMIDDGDDDDDD